MAEEHVTRKLAAILYADVAGYSRLTGEDEEGTHRAVADCLDVIAGTVSDHGGRVVHYAGDAVLAEFPSVIAAVKCAVEVQKDLATRSAGVPDNRKVQFRIGVNLGDVIVDRDDIYGNGVNVAARLESLADPGGICISRRVLEDVRGKVNVGFEFIGDKSVKNMADPIPVYRVLTDPSSAGKVIERTMLRTRPNRRLIAVALLVFAVVIAALSWYQPWATRFEPAAPARMALPLPQKPSIAVLPFASRGSDAKTALLAEGFTDDINTALSKLSELFVIARNATKKFKSAKVAPKEVSEALGIRFVLQGSAERNAKRLRIIVRLTDAVSGREVWAERYDRNVSDIFAIRDEVALKVVSEVGARISQGEQDRILRRGTTSLEAWILVRDAAYRITLLAPEHVKPAEEMAKRAIEIDPNYAAAYAALSGVYRQQGQNWPGDKSRKELFAESERLAKKALALDPDLDYAHLRIATLQLARSQHDLAVQSIEKAVGLMPNNWINQGVYGWILNHSGQPLKAESHLKLAARLNPNYPYWVLREIAHSEQLLGNYDESLATLRKVIASKPDRVTEMLARVRSAVMLVERGRGKDARQEVKIALQVFPRTSLAFLHKSRPYKDSAIYQRWDPILRSVGVPERGAGR